MPLSTEDLEASRKSAQEFVDAVSDRITRGTLHVHVQSAKSFRHALSNPLPDKGIAMPLTPSEKLKLANQVTAVLDAGLEGQKDPNGLGAEILILAAKARVGVDAASYMVKGS